LLSKGYEVHGIKRRSSSFNTSRIDHLFQDPHGKELDFKLRYGDMTDSTNLIRLMQEIQPDEIYNIAAQSHVQESSDTPEHPADAGGMGTLRLLDSIRILGMEKKCRFSRSFLHLAKTCAPTDQRRRVSYRSSRTDKSIVRDCQSRGH
jgi:GDPmannose 4,6-dehydratase